MVCSYPGVYIEEVPNSCGGISRDGRVYIHGSIPDPARYSYVCPVCVCFLETVSRALYLEYYCCSSFRAGAIHSFIRIHLM